MVLLIDNYDSFVHNLARAVREQGHETVVVRNDAATAAELAALEPDHVIVSPGPCTPAEAGVSVEVVRRMGARVPVLGVCLGHQCVAAAWGGRIVRAARPAHGKTTTVLHSGNDLFAGLPSPFEAGLYHSLAVDPGTLPAELEALATSAGGDLMALRHRALPVRGVQFHPESILTEHGPALIANFLALAPAPVAPGGTAA